MKTGNLGAITRRINSLPEYYMKEVKTILKKDAELFIIEFEKGLLKNTLGLLALKPNTVKQKIRKKYRKPKTPLAGKEKTAQDSYVNALELRATATGWVIRVRDGKHHSGLSFRHLFAIHDNGCTIKRKIKTKVGRKTKTKTITIIIPPRNARKAAYQKALRKISRSAQAKETKKAVTKKINESMATK